MPCKDTHLCECKYAVNPSYAQDLELTRVQFNKETVMYLTSGTLVFTSSHKVEFNQSLFKFPLQSSNLHLQWYFVGVQFFQVETLYAHSATIAKKYTC